MRQKHFIRKGKMPADQFITAGMANPLKAPVGPGLLLQLSPSTYFLHFPSIGKDFAS